MRRLPPLLLWLVLLASMLVPEPATQTTAPPTEAFSAKPSPATACQLDMPDQPAVIHTPHNQGKTMRRALLASC